MPFSRSARAAQSRMRPTLESAMLVVMVVVAGALVGGCAPQANPSSTGNVAVTGNTAAPGSSEIPGGAAGPSMSSAKGGSALAALATLAVKGRASRTGYGRELFGQAWADVDRNGCDTRNDILRRDLTPFVLKSGTNDCLVLSGTLHDPYLGRTITFVRGRNTSSIVQIDHVVPLSDAWQKGAQQWSTPRRTAFANDPLNLLAVDGLTNQRKSDGDAATWLPPNKGYRCSYAARQVAVKAKYGLWVTSAERDAFARILATCPSQQLPTAKS